MYKIEYNSKEYDISDAIKVYAGSGIYPNKILAVAEIRELIGCSLTAANGFVEEHPVFDRVWNEFQTRPKYERDHITLCSIITKNYINTFELKPCPFCGMELDITDPDTFYPNAIYWRQIKNEYEAYRIYVSHKEHNPETDHKCYNIICNGIYGGCEAEMHGDSVEETIEKWNRRV